MFDELDDPAPDLRAPETLTAVQARGRALRRRRQFAGATGAGTAVALVLAGVVWLPGGQADRTSSLVPAAPPASTAGRAPSGTPTALDDLATAAPSDGPSATAGVGVGVGAPTVAGDDAPDGRARVEAAPGATAPGPAPGGPAPGGPAPGGPAPGGPAPGGPAPGGTAPGGDGPAAGGPTGPARSASPAETAPTASPEPDPTPSPSPTTSAAPRVLELRGRDLGVTRVGAPRADAVAAVSAVLGAPTGDPSPTTRCVDAMSEVAWDGFHLAFDDEGLVSGWSNHRRELSTPAGVRLGTTVARLEQVYGDRLRLYPPNPDHGDTYGVAGVDMVGALSGPADDDVVVGLAHGACTGP